MKLFKFLIPVLLLTVFSCEDAGITPPTDIDSILGAWKGSGICTSRSSMEDVEIIIRRSNVSSDQLLIDMGDNVTLNASYGENGLVIHEQIVNEGGNIDVYKWQGTGLINVQGVLELNLNQTDLLDNNAQYTCTASLQKGS